MKYKDLVKKPTDAGFQLERTGDHEIYTKDGFPPIEVPHHKELNEITAKAILKKAEVK